MDLFETLGVSIGGRSVAEQIDSLRVTSDARAIEALHEPDDAPLQEYVVTVELTLSAQDKQEARDTAGFLTDDIKHSWLIDSDIIGVEEL